MFLANDDAGTFVAIDLFHHPTDQMDTVEILVRAPGTVSQEVFRILRAIRSGAGSGLGAPAGRSRRGRKPTSKPISPPCSPRRPNRRAADFRIYRNGRLAES